MAISNTYDFCIPEAQLLADLVGIRADLWSVQELVKTFFAYSPNNFVGDLWHKNALCIAALTTYGRTCGTGVRQKIPKEMIAALNLNHKIAHDYLKTLRDKWAAHSINNFEESRVTIQAHMDGEGKVVPTSIGDGHKNTSVLSRSDMRTLGDLAEELFRVVNDAIDHEKKKLLAHAMAMNLSILLSTPDAFARPEGNEAHDKPRRRF